MSVCELQTAAMIARKPNYSEIKKKQVAMLNKLCSPKIQLHANLFRMAIILEMVFFFTIVNAEVV